MTKEEFKAQVSEAYDVYEAWGEFLEKVWELSQPHWISVEDELPEEGDTVLVTLKNRITTITTTSYCVDGEWYDNDYKINGIVTHWMPLPKAPTTESKQCNKSTLAELEINDTIYPLTIIDDRYCGTYSGGAWLAFNLDCFEIPDEVYGDDVSCMCYWDSADKTKIGLGRTPQEAYEDLKTKLEKIMNND